MKLRKLRKDIERLQKEEKEHCSPHSFVYQRIDAELQGIKETVEAVELAFEDRGCCFKNGDYKEWQKIKKLLK